MKLSVRMKLEGIHHITAITGDAPANVDFYTRVLGLRLVKKSVNQDDPTVYHLFYADEAGSAGSDLTFFEYPGASRGRPGRGMVHRIAWRVASRTRCRSGPSASPRRASRSRSPAPPAPACCASRIPRGSSTTSWSTTSGDDPLIAEHPEVPAEHALRGFDGVRAYAQDGELSRPLLEGALAFEPAGEGWEARGERRGSTYVYDRPPNEAGIQGAGTVHHVAWATVPDEQLAWREAVLRAGGRPTPVIDRFYFRSVYFREPSGVLFEIATIGPGFTTDEPQESLGQKLALPPDYEHLRAQIEATVTPLPPTR